MIIKLFVKLLLSFLLLYLMTRKLDTDLFFLAVKTIHLSKLITFFTYVGISQMLGAFRWWRLAVIAGLDNDFGIALRSFFIGTYINLLGFGTIGGDFIKGTIIGKKDNKTASGIICAFADRLIGMLVLIVIGLTALMFWDNPKANYHIVRMLSGIGLLGIISWLVYPQVILKFLPKGGKLYSYVSDTLVLFTATPRHLFPVVILSLFYHLIQISLIFYLANQLNVETRYTEILTSIPFINILSLLPISWNGLGVRENAYNFFLSPSPLSIEQSTSISLLWFLAISLVSLCGGFASLLWNTKDNSRQ